jgi:hypothetical protein
MSKRAITTDIVLIDIIDFSRLSMDKQLEIISYLSLTYKKMILKMLKSAGITMDQMIQGMIPTGDGFYCILHPSLRGFGPILGLSFIHFSDYIAKAYPYFKGIRVAVHTGNIHRFEDILGHDNYVGDGLNECARYVDIKNLVSNTVIISDKASASLEEFFDTHNDYRQLMEKCELKQSSLHTFQDKHNFTHSGYLIWVRKGGIIPPPRPTWLTPPKKS